MNKRIQTILFALAAIAGSANAQSLSFEVQANEAKISLASATNMTALQFNLSLPEGVTIQGNNATIGEATDGHTLCIETLENGDHLFILYSMNLDTFKDGELLRIPININGDGTTRLYSVRFADTDAVSYAGADAEDIVTGISSLTPSLSPRRGEIYNVSGQKVGEGYKGIVIKDGRKVLK